MGSLGPRARCALVPLVGLAACAPYRPGALQRSAAAGSAVVVAGCLDVAARVIDDAVAAWPVVELRFGNRCDRPVPVDLRAIGGFGHTRGDLLVSLVAYDPNRELRPLLLEARTQGEEQLQYRDRRDLGVVGPDLVDLCLDLAALGGQGLVAGPGAPPVSCFERSPVEPAMAQVEVAR